MIAGFYPSRIDWARDRHAVYDRLRDAGPIHRSAEMPGVLFVVGWDEIKAMLSDPVFQRECPDAPVADRPADGRASPGLIELDQTWPVFRDPPSHTRLRTVMTAALAQDVVSARLPSAFAQIERLASELTGCARIEAVDAFANAVPAIASAALLGLDGSAVPLIREMLEGGATRRGFVPARVALVDLLADALATRRKAPGLDAMSRLADPAHGLSTREILSLALFIVTTGHGGVADIVASALHLVATGQDHGAIAALLPSRPEVLFRECLRLNAPLQMVDRWVGADCVRSDQNLRRGERVFLVVGAANHDPARFADPDRFDPGRREGGIGFGGGAHTCLGQTIAPRLWAGALTRFLQCAPRICADGPADWSPEIDRRSLLRLPLRIVAGQG